MCIGVVGHGALARQTWLSTVRMVLTVRTSIAVPVIAIQRILEGNLKHIGLNLR